MRFAVLDVIDSLNNGGAVGVAIMDSANMGAAGYSASDTITSFLSEVHVEL